MRNDALTLRSNVFRDGSPDADRFDDVAIHLVLRNEGGDVLATCRLLAFSTGQEIANSYSAQFYDLTKLSKVKGPCLELGRFCVAAHVSDPSVLRTLWTHITTFVLEGRIELLFGCSSFFARDPTEILDALSFLKENHTGPTQYLPGTQARDIIHFDALPPCSDRPGALRQIPPLLKTYLRMGGWVSDHAVIDRDLRTIHVFTGVEIAKIPPARRKALLRDAGHPPV
ncbi:MAG: GNAT family N-acyltransferase [Pseudomonadota bacterium]